MWTVDLPLAVPVSSRKWWWLNLNSYRNENYHTLNKAKAAFEDRVKPLLEDIPKLDRVLIAYCLYIPTKREPDLENVCTIVAKFFHDTLVRAGKLPDDKCSVLPMMAFGYGGVDNINPRVEATIHSVGPNPDITILDGLAN